ncbi:MAG: hypothetical protein U9N39_03480 [Campylobacterota bacterium]|nr:hypothetical protein [Campylobacterota bacterium]
MYTQFVKLLLLTVFLLSLSNCGYKPSAKYVREVLGKKISTSVVVSMEDPQNSVIIKDAVDQAVVDIFHASISDRKYADTHLDISTSEPIYVPLQYNDNGFVISYRATINMKITRISKTMKKNYTSLGNYDFSVVPNAVFTDQERFDAIKFSSIKAISSFVAQVSAEGSRIK